MKTFSALLALAFVAFSTPICWSANRVIDISDSEKVQVYDEPGSFTWIAPNNLTGTAQLLVVGGGGAGGGRSGGGGGGGQVVYVSAATLTAGASYTVTVADGGAAATGLGTGANGGDSSLSGTSFTTITAIGGGGGGGGWSPVNGSDGANGGGAGGNGNTPAKSGGQPTVEGGHKGADSVDGKNWAYGGGGGMTEDGHVYNETGKEGAGGAGVTYSITGSDKMYGYGGGAARNAKVGGLSGAGNEWGKGSSSSVNDCTAGEEGTGGGGGGGLISTGPGADGGSGTVIIRYTLDTAKDDFSANITRSIRVPTTVTFTANLGTELSTMTWNFGDGSEEVQTTELTVTHEYAAAGVYTVTMTHGSQVVTKQDYVEIISGVLYVDAASANPTPPYNTRATAATKVNDAMAYAQNGFEVRIAPGDYPLNDLSNLGTVYIDVTNAVTVIGEGDSPTNVILRSTHRRPYFNDKVMRINNSGAKVVNVTLADGSVSNGGWGGCLLIDVAGGVVSNCVIRNGWASRAIQARVGGAYLNAGLVTHTIFEECKFDASYDLSNVRIASGAVLAGKASIENCLFRSCTGGAGDIIALTYAQASVVNCTIVGGQIGFWTGNSNVTNDSYVIGGEQGIVKNCAVYNVKRIAYNDQPETYDAAFGPKDSVFTSCVKAEKEDFRNYDAGNLMPHVGGALYDQGTTIDGFANIKDLSGNPRVFGKAIDVGCYESQLSPGFMLFVR